MSDLRTIEIDFEVHQRIEQERRGFHETPNDVLHRLLNIETAPTTGASVASAGRPWSGKGVTLPHGTEVRMEYNGSLHRGIIDNGEWLIEGQRFQSPSAAAGGVALTRAGRRPSLDGWIYWQVKRPGDHDWIAISLLRRKAA